MEMPARLVLVAAVVLLTACRSEVPVGSIKDAPARPPAAEDKLHTWCWNRYPEYLNGTRPETLDEKLKGDAICRPVICPTCRS
jgi:hypothetical protein